MKNVEEADAVSILEFFKDLPDPRSSINRKHLLGEIMVIWQPFTLFKPLLVISGWLV